MPHDRMSPPARALAVLAAACAALLLPGLAQGRTLADIRSSGELRICVAGSSADFYRANGEEFARYLGVRAKVETLPNWDAQFHDARGTVERDARYEAALLASGRCDLYPNDLHIVPWRELKMRLVPYFATRNMVVARPDMRSVLHGPQDLPGRVAAVQAGTAYESWLRSFNAEGQGEPVLIRTAPTAQAMKEVVERRADFTVIAAEAAFKWVRDDLDNLDLLFPVGEGTEVGWGMGFHAHDLEKALRAFFADSRRVGSGLDLSWRKKYGVSLMEYQLFSASLDTGHPWRDALAKWGLPAGSAVAGVLLAMGFWAGRLRREVRQHRLAAQALRESQALMAAEVGRRKAVSDLLTALQLVDTLEAFGQVTLRELAHHLPLGQALIALVDDGDNGPGQGGVWALAHYAGAGATAAQTLAEVPTTAELLMRCIATAEPVLVESPGPEHLRIRSGLGHCTPAAILLVPIRHAGRVIAVVEVATTQPVVPEYRELLAVLEPIIATGIHRFHREFQLVRASHAATAAGNRAQEEDEEEVLP